MDSVMRTTVSRFQNKLRSGIPWELIALFYVLTVFFSLFWHLILTIQLSIDQDGMFLYMLVVSIVSVTPAILTYLNAPEEKVDSYHHAGVLFAMFLPINIILTVGFYLQPLFLNEAMDFSDSIFSYLVVGGVFSSLWLPGPYAGAYFTSFICSYTGYDEGW